jgi:hypothetical protein
MNAGLLNLATSYGLPMLTSRISLDERAMRLKVPRTGG